MPTPIHTDKVAARTDEGKPGSPIALSSEHLEQVAAGAVAAALASGGGTTTSGRVPSERTSRLSE